MSGTRGYLSGFPDLHLRPELEFNDASVNHDIFVLEPVLVPLLPINLDSLDEISLVLPCRSNTQRLVTIDGHVEIWKPR